MEFQNYNIKEKEKKKKKKVTRIKKMKFALKIGSFFLKSNSRL